MKRIAYCLMVLLSQSLVSAQAPSVIKLKELDGRTWLVDKDGQPFFAHGVTHVGYGHNGEDVGEIANALKQLGFNSYGYGCPEFLKSDMPYVQDNNEIALIAIYRGKNAQFFDIFDPQEQARMERAIEKVCAQNRNNTSLIGYYWTDLAAWPLKNQTGTNWVEYIRDLPADTPGQIEYQKFLQNWKGDDDTERDTAFLTLIAREYFRVCGEANRRYDPHHLIFGDRYLFQTVVPEVIKESLPYIDAVAIQPNFNPGFPRKEFDRIHELTDKPIILCDFNVTFKEEGKQVFGWMPVENAAVAGPLYAQYIQEALATPYILGSFWCQPVTEMEPAFYPPGYVKVGIFKPGLQPRPALNKAIRGVNEHLVANTPGGGLRPTGAIQKPEPKKGPGILLDFEDKSVLAGNNTSHKATVSLIDDVPEDGGAYAAKTVIDSNAGAGQYFGTGFQFPVTDLSAAGTISLWIKTDIESSFNLQLHSDANGLNGVSVFPFSTIDSKGQWKKVTARLARFSKPPWAKSKADLSRIIKVQATAFSSGPYDGKQITIDNVRVDGVARRNASPEIEPERLAILKSRRANLREPVILQQGESVEMFDGKTLDGWSAIPRVYVPRGEPFNSMPADQLYDAVIEHYENSDGQINRIPNRERVRDKGVWKIEDGVVIGGQTPGSIAGAYLMSEKKYGDFELTLEANPDYPIDTGIMVRAHELGSVGFQVLVDNRPNGTIGGVYGNSVGGFFAYPFVFNAEEEPLNKVGELRPGDPNAMQFRGGQFPTDFAASLDDFKKVWKPNDWNEIRIRCTGRLPLIETWINGVAIAKIDTATLADIVPGYDPEAIYERIGRQGHIGLEVHDSPTRDRWAPGAECRWRNVRIRELVCEDEVTNAAQGKVSLAKIDGRHWLVDSTGKPFFAHGITHTNNRSARLDFHTFSERCKELGFNAYGYGCPDQLRHDMPFVEGWNHLVPSSTYRGKNATYVDIFDPRAQSKLEQGVKASCLRALQHPENVIGFCWTDLGAWPLKNSTGSNWVKFIRNLPEDAPGQKAWQSFLSSWEGDDEEGRDQAFLRLIAREYFRVVGGANRKYAPGHLIFGDRFAFNTIDHDVIQEMLPWVDAIAIQPNFWGPFPTKQLSEIYQLSGKPIVLCDFAIRFKDGDKDVRMWKLAEDSADAGVVYSEYVEAAMKSEYILGVFWCNPVDTPKGFGKSGVKQGFFGDGLVVRPGLHESVKRLNARREKLTPRGVVDEK